MINASIRISLCLSLLVSGHVVKALNAPGKPGITPTWSSAKKVQVGTSRSKDVQVWFSNASGVLTEVYYPSVDQAQLRDSQLIVTDQHSFMVEERTQTKQSVKTIHPSMVTLVNEDYQDRFAIMHTFFTSSKSNTLIDEVIVTTKQKGLGFYLLLNPHLKNSGWHDNGYAFPDSLFFMEGNTQLKVSADVGFLESSVGYVGRSDGWTDLNQHKKMTWHHPIALDGNIAGIAKINIPDDVGQYKFYVVYHFGEELQYPLNYEEEKQKYLRDWDDYLNKLSVPPNLNRHSELLYLRSLYTLKVHEDKNQRGAFVASLSIPWGEDLKEQDVGGYHLVWPRDLYHISLAMLLAGERESAVNAMKYLQKIQYDAHSGAWNYEGKHINKRGAFPQNTWINGKPYWTNLQLDQVGYAVLLFYHLYLKSDEQQKRDLLNEFKNLLTTSLHFIATYGPWTKQERWEENEGISPSTFSAATAALIAGSEIFRDSTLGAVFGQTAKRWLYEPEQNIDTWAYTTSGFWGDGDYYLRISACNKASSQWDPNLNVDCIIANSWQSVPMKFVLDQGFLQLALLGLKNPNDEKIVKSWKLVNKHIAMQTRKGKGWYRYTFDAYGENGKGRLWPIFNSEQGRYALAMGEADESLMTQSVAYALEMKSAIEQFANAGMMIPEQVFEDSGDPTGAATPLAWAHAEYIKLLWSIEQKSNVENPFNDLP